MTRFGCVAGIQARMSSSRLPGKVLADVCGKPLVQRIYERARTCTLVDEVFVLTSVHPSDDVLAAKLEELSIPFRRGPLDDVLTRFMDLAEESRAVHVVRLSGDCPLVDPDFIDLQLGALRAFDGDLVRVANNEGGAIEGTLGGQQALSVRSLRLIASSSDTERNNEHVGSFFYCERALEVGIQAVEVEVDPVYERPGLRLQVDERADLEFVRTVWRAVDIEGDGLFPVARALRWIAEHPEARRTNAHVQESADNRALRRLSRASERHGRPR